MTTETPVADTDIPEPIAAYHRAANAQDWPALAASFTAGGVVHDEGKTYVGRDEIQAWREAIPWTYTTQLGTTTRRPDGAYEVAAHMEGDFPGGVVDVTWRFRLEGDLIAELVC